jgi:hypothetical protein
MSFSGVKMVNDSIKAADYILSGLLVTEKTPDYHIHQMLVKRLGSNARHLTSHGKLEFGL